MKTIRYDFTADDVLKALAKEHNIEIKDISWSGWLGMFGCRGFSIEIKK